MLENKSTSSGPSFATRSPATPSLSWLTAMTSSAVSIFSEALLSFLRSVPITRGDFRIAQRPKFARCSCA